ncbi:hypothetical protein VTN77DRAFT_50 [Rasamsonia byssochlamydoides]|uniref:uncharacterized protein n=1 Tax=Rasamsonia byssochlamydoides TaxID=89139 RepID=UPI003744207C
MAPKEGSSRFHPYEKAKKPPMKHAKPRVQLSVNELKKRIRDVKRLLNHKDLPADARIVQERALAGYEKDLKEELERRKRSEMIKRYHFVRFLDRKAATKELKRLLRRQRELSKSNPPPKPEALARIAEKIHEAQINVNYTIYYPLTEKYISLYPHEKRKERKKEKESADGGSGDSDDNNDNANGTSGDELFNDLLLAPNTNPDEKPPMWHVVKKCTEENTLDLLREGKLDIGVDGKPKKTTDTAAATAASEQNGNSSNGKAGKAVKDGASKQQQQQQQKKKDKNQRDSQRRKRDRDPESMDVDSDDDDKSDGGFFEE